MTPSQMLSRRVPAKECCEADLKPTSFDYAGSSGFTPYECLKKHTCPICGEKGTSSTIQNMDTTFFYCKNRAHIFEIDDETCEVDRIGR